MNRTNYTAIVLVAVLTLAMASSAHAQPRGGRGGGLGQIFGEVGRFVDSIDRGGFNRGGGNSNRGGSSNRSGSGWNRSRRGGSHEDQVMLVEGGETYPGDYNDPPPRPNETGAIIEDVGNLVGGILRNIPKNDGGPRVGRNPGRIPGRIPVRNRPEYRENFDYNPPPKNYYPPSNTRREKVAEASVKRNILEAVLATTVNNSPGLDSLLAGVEVEGLNLTDEIPEMQEENEDHADTLKDPVKEEAKKDIDDLVGYDEATKDEMKDRIDNEESLDDLFTGADPVGEGKIGDHTDLIDKINQAKEDANDGKPDKDDLADLAPEVITYVAGDPAAETAAADAILGLGMNGENIGNAQDADPNNGDLTLGDSDVILVGGLDEGEIVSLGNGTVLVGTGDPAGGCYFGTGNVAQLAGYSAGIGDPLPESEAKLVTDGVVLINGGNTPVNYNVDNKPFTMQPDYRQALPGGRSWLVEFDTAGSQGTVKKTVTEGTYKFTPTENGWELYKHTFKVTVDNDNPFALHYIIDNQQQTVAANQKREHTSAYPPIIRFDDGQGNEKKKRVNSGVYRVAVTPEGAIDLYDEDDVAAPVKIADVIPPDPTPEEFFRDPKKVTSRLFTNRFTPDSSDNKKKKSSSIFGNKRA